MNRVRTVRAALSIVILSVLALSCNRSESTKSPPLTSETVPADKPKTVSVPAELQKDIDAMVQAVETLDIPKVLASYADDYTSGTGRSKDGVRDALINLQERRVAVTVEKAEVEEVSADQAKLKTQLRLRYKDTFRDIAEGEMLVTDILRHSLRKENSHWKIYADERLSTYREGRYGGHSPNIHLEVPARLPEDPTYTVTVTAQRDPDKNYQVMVNHYPEDPQFLPPPDVVTELPENGVLTADLPRNEDGESEMVRITVVVEDQDENFIGATIVSKFVPGLSLNPEERQDKEDEALI
jgi:hypothetical protein